jgi:hypothetical protein
MAGAAVNHDPVAKRDRHEIIARAIKNLDKLWWTIKTPPCGSPLGGWRGIQRPTNRQASYNYPKVSLTLVKAPGKVTPEIMDSRAPE